MTKKGESNMDAFMCKYVKYNGKRVRVNGGQGTILEIVTFGSNTSYHKYSKNGIEFYFWKSSFTPEIVPREHIQREIDHWIPQYIKENYREDFIKRQIENATKYGFKVVCSN